MLIRETSISDISYIKMDCKCSMLDLSLIDLYPLCVAMGACQLKSANVSLTVVQCNQSIWSFGPFPKFKWTV